MNDGKNNTVGVKRTDLHPPETGTAPRSVMLNEVKHPAREPQTRRGCSSLFSSDAQILRCAQGDKGTDALNCWQSSCNRTFARVGGFTLLEVMTALAILGLVSSSVLLVIDRCVGSAADSALRREAFELARENLEAVLVRDSVEETIEYGTSEKYADVSWQTVIEAFPEPVSGQMWIRAICSAEYTDSKGQSQKVELTHWIAKLTEQQAGQLIDTEELERLEVEQVLPSAKDAADYAGVDADTIDQWVENGLVLTGDGRFVKYNLDVFVKSQGDPSDEEKAKQVISIEELAMAMRTMQRGLEDADSESQGSGVDPLTGLSYEELQKMDIGEVVELLRQKQQ
ncbi:MAG: prepilin-type N-terminal cleavage/methylation domain-containing protein [Phycisphaerae bacterium]|nr:prepilin-type N-terminal cleavage/methylation domain-containing protein [Phycisphaerae bacterium]